jgi:hypothetical protein
MQIGTDNRVAFVVGRNNRSSIRNAETRLSCGANVSRNTSSWKKQTKKKTKKKLERKKRKQAAE